MKIVVAYSGGLDMPAILHWLKESCQSEVITFSVAPGLWGFLSAITGKIGEYLISINDEIGNKPKYVVRKIHQTT